jgi:hypothetical protein
MYKAIKIDVDNQTISQVEINGLEDLQKIVEGRIEAVQYLENGDVCFGNEEGLFCFGDQPKGWFHIQGAYQPTKGNGVIVGTTEEGESVEPKITVEEVKSITEFKDLILV